MKTLANRRILFLAAAILASAIASSFSGVPAQAQTSAVRAIAELVAKPGQADAMRAMLAPFAAQSRKEPGCLSYELLEVQGDPGHFVTVETWADKGALDAHMATPQIKAALPVIGPMLAKPFTQTLLTDVKG